MGSIYGKYEEYLRQVCDDLRQKVEGYSSAEYSKSGTHISEHIDIRIKSDVSMREKCRKKGLEETAENALSAISDSIGMRIVCSFTDDIYKNISYIRSMEGCTVIKEKDYITHAKPNGYRSYHMIISLEEPFEDVFGNVPGRYKAEIQLQWIHGRLLNIKCATRRTSRTSSSLNRSLKELQMSLPPVTFPCRP